MSVAGYNVIPDVNDDQVIAVEYDECNCHTTMYIDKGHGAEEISLTLSELKALCRQMNAIVEYIERQK